MHRADELGAGQAVGFLREVDAINMRRRARTVDLVTELVEGNLVGAKIACLGAAFKPNSDDIRDAPALDVASRLHEAGAIVTVFDPVAMDNARRAHPELRYGDSAMGAARDADVVVLLTEWVQFRQIDPVVLGSVVAHRRVVDGRHALDPVAWREAGWQYRALGRQ
jgi:UDPglucose 6-dehydrogenase